MIKAFKAYDIRGVYGTDFTREQVYKAGYFLPQLLHSNKILVGRDIRLSSNEIFEALALGITHAGANVYDMGLATTPMVYYYTASHHFAASVQITASHNPKHHNGLKISAANAIPVGYDTGLKELEYSIEHLPVKPAEHKGRIISISPIDEYCDFLLQYKPHFEDMKVVADCSNGVANLLATRVLGTTPYYINNVMDGNFPAHEPNPLEPQNVVQLQQEVRSRHADVGIIFDGDADRMMLVDENGDFISPDLIIALLGHYFLEQKHQTGKVLFDIRTSNSVKEYLTRMGAQVNIWKVGRAYAALKLREIDGLFGGELAGHYYFKDFFYSDSGMLAAILVLNILADFKRKGLTVSQVIGRIKTYANSGEINYTVAHKQQVMDKVKDYFTARQNPIAFYDFDGYRVEFEDWWFNIRPSNTEPYLRFIAEARTQKLLDEKLAIVRTLVEE